MKTRGGWGVGGKVQHTAYSPLAAAAILPLHLRGGGGGHSKCFLSRTASPSAHSLLRCCDTAHIAHAAQRQSYHHHHERGSDRVCVCVGYEIHLLTSMEGKQSVPRTYSDGIAVFGFQVLRGKFFFFFQITREEVNGTCAIYVY